MTFRRVAAQFALMAMCSMTIAAPAQAHFWQCVPYARLISGIDIRGNALTWWNQAVGRYARGSQPQTGAVMAFAPTARMRLGHVATVSRVVNDREILLTHANWSRRGGIEKDVRAVDVSSEGDWSEVKVWYAGNGGLGTSIYPVRGFIYSGAAPVAAQSVASADTTKDSITGIGAPQVGSN